ncbi:MAG: hypothetical protein B7Y70_01205 [Rhizobiales bacterium 35-68-8]|nr:MAG: hypothetical protein B7Y70_01205 [Rhizobiales bacterium 35-68-8]
MACFWERGYEAASLRDLTDCMGISSPSLYAAFGHKRSLFSQALEHYCQTITHDRIARLEAEFPARARAGAFLAEVIALAVGDTQRRGCLLVNTAIEVAPHDAEIGERVQAHLNEVRAFFERSFVASVVAGALPPETDCPRAADLMMAVLLGIRVLARTQALTAQLDGIAFAALASLGLGDTLACQRARAAGGGESTGNSGDQTGQVQGGGRPPTPDLSG